MYVAPQSVIIAQPSKRLPAIRPRPVSKLAKRLGRLGQVHTYLSGVTAAVSAPCAPFRCGVVEWLGRLPRPFIFQKTLWLNAHGIAWHGTARHGYDYGYAMGMGMGMADAMFWFCVLWGMLSGTGRKGDEMMAH